MERGDTTFFIPFFISMSGSESDLDIEVKIKRRHWVLEEDRNTSPLRIALLRILFILPY
jgi:hypothetical protein